MIVIIIVNDKTVQEKHSSVTHTHTLTQSSKIYQNESDTQETISGKLTSLLLFAFASSKNWTDENKEWNEMKWMRRKRGMKTITQTNMCTKWTEHGTTMEKTEKNCNT